MALTKLVFFVILLMCIVIYKWIYNVPSIYVKSSIDGRYYLVRDDTDKHIIANNLATIRKNVKSLTKYMIANPNPKYAKYIENLHKIIGNVAISENVNETQYTSYSVNKGDKLVFCMKSKDNAGKIHDTNLMMYVVLHEISHIACPEYGHGSKFKEIFKYITENAINLGMYVPVDFKAHPTEYCGMTISSSIV